MAAAASERGRGGYPDFAGFSPNHSHLIKARDGSQTLEIEEGGDRYLLHSKYRPLQEAQRQIDELNYCPGDTLLFLGLGLGHSLKLLEQQIYSPTVVIIVERDREIFYRACETYDFAALFARPQTYLIVGEDAAFFSATIHPQVHNWASIPLHTLVQKPSLQRHSAYYTTISQALKNEIFWAGTALKSAVELSAGEMKNRFAIAPWYFGSDSLCSFKDHFKDRAGVVVGAGPSLSSSLPALKEQRDRVAICCAGTALKPLLRSGIVPDVVVSLDYHPFSADYVAIDEFKIAPEQLPLLVIDPRASVATLEKWRGPACFVPEARTEWLRGDFTTRAPIVTGGSVGIMAFTTLAYMGASRIALVGMDLANTYGLTHAPGVSHYDIGWTTLNRFSTYEMMGWERVLRFRSELIAVTDYDGNPVYSDTRMLSYLHELEAAMAAYGKEVYDAARGGVAKINSVSRELSDYLGDCRGELSSLTAQLPVCDHTGFAPLLDELRESIVRAQAAASLGELEGLLREDERLQRSLHFLAPQTVLQYNRGLREKSIAVEMGCDFDSAEIERAYLQGLRRALTDLATLLP